MKKIASILVALVVLGTFGCQQKKEEKSQVVYTPPSMPTQLEIEQMQQTAKAAPKNAEAWTHLGDSLMDAQRFPEAIDAYEKALALNPKNVNVLVDQGTCYRGIGKFDKAVEQYRKAIKIDPSFPNAHRNLGVVLSFDLHDNKQALPEFQKYLELMPNAQDAETIRQTIKQLSGGK
jgi:tetratricopeptide (TPR) repeat protein